MPIDTDDLSDEVYKAIIAEADRFNSNLTIQFGLISYQCHSENEFIQQSKALIKELKKYKKQDWEDVFLDDLPNQKDINAALDKISDNIARLKKANTK